MKTIYLLSILVLAGCESKVSQDAAYQEIKQRRTDEVRDDVYTVEHDGHQFVVYRGSQKGGIIHHPGCKCLK